MLTKLNIPNEAIYEQFIPKKQFYEQADFTQREKNLFVQDVERVTLYAQLMRDNTNIPKYEVDGLTYDEVSITLLELKQIDRLKRIAEIMMTAIPYPMLIIAAYDGKYNFIAAHQRDNLQDKSKIILEEVFETGFTDGESLITIGDYERLSKVHFYDLYDNLLQNIITYNLTKRNVKNKVANEELLKQIEGLEEDIESLKSKMKKEKHFNKKMDIHMKIKRLEKQLEELKG